MVNRLKIDSNETGLSYALEESIGVLPVSGVVWYPLEPNSYDDFGGELTLLARNPINRDRQRKKGVITDLEAAGGFNQDFTQTNTQDLLQGVMFADFREKASEVVTAVLSTGYTVATSAGFAAGQLIFASGFNAAANNGLKVVTSVTALEVLAAGLVAAPGDVGEIVVVGRQATAGDLDVTAPGGDYPGLSSTTLDFTTLGLIPGEWIFVGGDAGANAFVDPDNNGFKRVYSVTANALKFDRSVNAMSVEASTTETIRDRKSVV